jgi:DNA-binding MarR family transcriptional regulator
LSESEQTKKALIELGDLFTRHFLSSFYRFGKARDISPAQLGMLFQLGRPSAQGLGRLGEELQVSSAAVSQMIERLVQAGLVERSESVDDRRSKKIGLTAEGRKLLEECKEERQLWITKLVDGLGEEEAGRIIAAIKTVLAKAKESEGKEKTNR